jgi:hypothetical protein
MPPKRVNYPKVAGILGLLFGILFGFFVAAGPRLRGGEIPLPSLLIRVVCVSFFMGPFGLAAGTGVGLLLQGFVSAVAPPPGSNARAETDPQSSASRTDS